jgi:hypothetical protein
MTSQRRRDGAFLALGKQISLAILTPAGQVARPSGFRKRALFDSWQIPFSMALS